MEEERKSTAHKDSTNTSESEKLDSKSFQKLIDTQMGNAATNPGIRKN